MEANLTTGIWGKLNWTNDGRTPLCGKSERCAPLCKAKTIERRALLATKKTRGNSNPTTEKNPPPEEDSKEREDLKTDTEEKILI